MFEELRRVIAEAAVAGTSLDTIEKEIIDRCPLDDEQQAALWLYAEALLEHPGGFTRDDRMPASVGS
jgi:hypothetical protein